CPARTAPTAAPGPGHRLALGLGRRSPAAQSRRAATGAWRRLPPPWHAAARSPAPAAGPARPGTRRTRQEMRSPWGFTPLHAIGLLRSFQRLDGKVAGISPAARANSEVMKQRG